MKQKKIIKAGGDSKECEHLWRVVRRKSVQGWIRCDFCNIRKDIEDFVLFSDVEKTIDEEVKRHRKDDISHERYKQSREEERQRLKKEIMEVVDMSRGFQIKRYKRLKSALEKVFEK